MQFFRSCAAVCVVLMAFQAGGAHAASAAQKKAQAPEPLPVRQPGLWEVTVRSDDLQLRRRGQAKAQPQTVRMCTDAEAEPVMLFAIVPGQENCRQVTTNRRSAEAGGGWDIHSVCFVHDNQVEMRMQLTGDLRTAYQGSFNVTFRDTPMNNTGRMLFEGHRLGACLAQQRAGDMVLPNGITVNVVDDRRHAEAHGEHGH
ncbi:DUF3617 family protein [Comamonas sp. NLF-1-9]|uniref:DUF3617 domain-containing protein n=1 Tax=Comamonas sp. NLF-1-9 TaxID=2853163 RepID=UPI001C46D4B4|nr:DUF3617 family protein [Comamonas sp. NLF-1-9]QXL83589.1 DUF3617 domain-containing protein [Comamonas sp. NLF-1-9]